MVWSGCSVASWALVAVASATTVACGSNLGQGIDTNQLEVAYARARETPGIHSLLVQRHGVLVAEEYFNGSGPDDLEEIWSVTKSVVSILTGIALERGYLQSLDQRLDEFLRPVVDNLPADKGQITIRQLLTMTSGLQWHELDGGGEYTRWIASGDMVQYVIDRPWASSPGTEFLYNTGGLHLVSVILTEATGESTLEFARRYLFTPLGITEYVWPTDDRGYYTGGAGLYLHPRDMVKIGELFLRRGEWAGSRVVVPSWVEVSTAPYIGTGSPVGPWYGYAWWIGSREGRDFYFASGWAGQFILVSPELDLVVVATSGWRGLGWDAAAAQWSEVADIIVNDVLPAADH